jgi:hypothetical protein
MSDDINLDDLPDVNEEQAKPKVKSPSPVWMVVMVIIAFICFAATLTFQILEYRYLRGASPSDTDPYAGQVLIRPTS